MGILSSLMSDSAHYKGIKGRYLMGGALAAGGIAYAAGGVSGGWKKEDGSKRSLSESLGSGAKTLAMGAAVGLGLGAGLMYAGNVANLYSTSKAAGLGFNPTSALNIAGGAARLTGQQLASTARQYSRLFSDDAVKNIMTSDGAAFIANKPHLATKLGRTAEVGKQIGRGVESVVEHTAGWLGKNWMPHLKGQGSVGDIAGAYVMAGAGAYSAYEAGKHAYEGDLGGAVKAGSMFAAEKYLFMGWKNRAGIMNFAKNAKLADYGAIAMTGLNVAASARTAAFEGGMYGASFIKTGVSPTGYLAARGLVLGDEGMALVQQQAVEHLKTINNMSPEHFQKMMKDPNVQEVLNKVPKMIHQTKNDAVNAKRAFLEMNPEELTNRISKGQRTAIEEAPDVAENSYLASEGAKAYGRMDTSKVVGYATSAQSALGKMEGQFATLQSQGRSLKVSGDLSAQVDQLHAKFSQVPGFDDAWQKIQGMSEQGMAAKRRKTGTDFGSPYQGPKTSNNIHHFSMGPARPHAIEVSRAKSVTREAKIFRAKRNAHADSTMKQYRMDMIGESNNKQVAMARRAETIRDTRPMISGQIAKAKSMTSTANESARTSAAAAASATASEAEMAGAFASVTSNKGSFLGKMHSMFGAGGEAREAKMLGTSITHGGEKMTMAGAIAINAGNPEMLGELGKQFGNMYSKGAGFFDMGASARVMLNMNKSVMSTNMDIAKGAYRAGSAVTKATLGASLGQLGFAGAVVAGVGVLAANAMNISGQEVMESAHGVHEHMRESARPHYGSSELGQSTQGLSFGLHSRRRG
jgi:hypothetical protein